MEAIREIRHVENGKVILHLPHDFWGQDVEIIILPVQHQDKQLTHKESLRGCLQQYARPELIAKEKEAWQDAIREKYVSR